jgi:methionine aminotransferase
VFDGKTHESILRYPDLFQRAFVTFSFGKVYQCTGWKIGYCVAPEWLMQEFSKVHQYNCFSVNTPVQYALSSFIKDKNEYLQLGSFFQEKRDLFYTLMSQTKFKAIPSYGSYFQLYDYSEISSQNDFDFAKTLTEKAGVATIPVSSFYQQPAQNKVLRFCFAKKDETLQQAVEQILKFQNEIV